MASIPYAAGGKNFCATVLKNRAATPDFLAEKIATRSAWRSHFADTIAAECDHGSGVSLQPLRAAAMALRAASRCPSRSRFFFSWACILARANFMRSARIRCLATDTFAVAPPRLFSCALVCSTAGVAVRGTLSRSSTLLSGCHGTIPPSLSLASPRRRRSAISEALAMRRRFLSAYLLALVSEDASSACSSVCTRSAATNRCTLTGGELGLLVSVEREEDMTCSWLWCWLLLSWRW